ncbi:MAG: flagellar hook-basal body complex protein FliE [Solirubrobacteraceae bacterium]|nr:flagellar hook-basal body complex protein FliE [Solirubrobacteraceae bacterium]
MSPIPATGALGGIGGPEWQIGGLGGVEPGQKTGSGNFGQMLGQQIQGVADTQTEAATQSRALATGEATDPTEVVMSVERAQLAMQMATTMRNKGVEVVQELMRTQV